MCVFPFPVHRGGTALDDMLAAHKLAITELVSRVGPMVAVITYVQTLFKPDVPQDSPLTA